MNKIRVLLVDDHPVVRAGLRTLLESEDDIEVVGEAADGAEAIKQIKKAQPGVVLMDISMPGVNGLDATKDILKENPKVKILVLTMHDDEGYLRQFLGAGASGYIVKRAASNELLAAIRAVHRGEMFLSLSKEVMTDYMYRPSKPIQEIDKPDSLTKREREVLKLIAAGYTNREIGEQLYISIKTVETHRIHIMKKLNLKGRAELVRYAVKQGLFKVET